MFRPATIKCMAAGGNLPSAVAFTPHRGSSPYEEDHRGLGVPSPSAGQVHAYQAMNAVVAISIRAMNR